MNKYKLKLRQITIKYDCPNLKKTVSKNIESQHYINVEVSDHPWYGHVVDVDLKCKCGKYHNLIIKD